MKKTCKIMSIILLVIMFVAIFSGTVCADTDIGSVLDELESETLNTESMTNTGSQIISIIQVIGIIITVLILLAL